MYGCQQVLIHVEKDTQAILEYLCAESNKVYNCSLYYRVKRKAPVFQPGDISE